MPQITNNERARRKLLTDRGLQDCRHCLKVFPFSEFGPNARKPLGIDNYCRPCKLTMFREWAAKNSDKKREYNKQWFRDNPAKGTQYARSYRKRRWIDATLRMIRSKCLKAGVPYDLHNYRDQLVARHSLGRCEMTGIAFAPTGDPVGRLWNSPSFDRLNAKGGYTYDNVRLVIWIMNTAMGDWGEQTLREVMTEWLSGKHDADAL